MLEHTSYSSSFYLISYYYIQDLQRGVIEWVSILEDRGMKINITKSKVTKIGQDEIIKIQRKQQDLEQIDAIAYLCTTIFNENIMDEEINNILTKSK